MKVLIPQGRYTFDKTAKTITLLDYPIVKLAGFGQIYNASKAKYIFQTNKTTGTVATNVLTLTYDTSAMSNTDELHIEYNDAVDNSVRYFNDTYTNERNEFTCAINNGTRTFGITGFPNNTLTESGVLGITLWRTLSGYKQSFEMPLNRLLVANTGTGTYTVTVPDAFDTFNSATSDTISMITHSPEKAYDSVNDKVKTDSTNSAAEDLQVPTVIIEDTNTAAATGGLSIVEWYQLGSGYKVVPNTIGGIGYVINTAGTGYTNGTQSITITNPDGGTATVLSVTVAGNVVTTINSITTAGTGYLNSTIASLATTGGGGTGFTVKITGATITLGLTSPTSVAASVTTLITAGVPSSATPTVGTAGTGFSIADGIFPTTYANAGSGAFVNVLDVTGIYYPSLSSSAGTIYSGKDLMFDIYCTNAYVTIEGSNDPNASAVERHDCTELCLVTKAHLVNKQSKNKVGRQGFRYFFNDRLGVTIQNAPFKYYWVKVNYLTSTHIANIYQWFRKLGGNLQPTPNNLSIIQEIQQYGEYRGRKAYIFNILGRRSGFTSTTVFNDIKEFDNAVADIPVLNNATLDVISDSVQDLPAGTGAATIKVVYINNKYQLTESAAITLNGTTLVTSVLTGVYGILWAEVVTHGSGAPAASPTAVGNIRLRINGGTVEVEQITAGGNKSLSGRFMTPANMSSYIMGWEVTSIGTATQDVRLRATVNSLDRTLTSVFRFQDTAYLAAASQHGGDTNWIKLPPLAKCKVSTISSATQATNRVDVNIYVAMIANQ